MMNMRTSERYTILNGKSRLYCSVKVLFFEITKKGKNAGKFCLFATIATHHHQNESFKIQNFVEHRKIKYKNHFANAQQ